MTRLIIGAVIGVGILVSAFGYGVRFERSLCNERIKAAEKRFNELQDSVKLLVEQYEQTVDLAKKEQEDAAKLKEILARLQSTASAKCTLDNADVSDASRLRDGPASPSK
jgi:hypothetical protein